MVDTGEKALVKFFAYSVRRNYVTCDPPRMSFWGYRCSGIPRRGTGGLGLGAAVKQEVKEERTISSNRAENSRVRFHNR